MASTLTQELLDPILTTDPAGPRVTYYDDATGERVEVSGVTLANWAAKTANFLRDELGVEPGTRVSVLLPAHWQTAAVLLGAWWAGADVTLSADPDVEVALVHGGRIDDAGDVPEVVALSLDAFGRPVADLPVGVTDYATSVRVHGDQFRPSGQSGALDGRSVDEVLGAARARAEAHSIAVGDRVLSSLPWTTADELIDGLLSVLAAGASLVQVSSPDDSKTERRVATEKVTKTL
ncbi:TIGR03089 family protein [Rhodococcus sp. 06-156-3C]|uniref:TIGR03089 family protein n=1 Tax=Nocardiaceae TaxID=85025 RepID=UPI00052305BD|nr:MULTISPECIES: TIGR03089 family protein [Rhodococcus]OZD19391.1 TIGR03089 family protein [Rhodococcus sp. 06-156-3C]OZD21725.1 TIGR03089 family protein [Rhodococcus sp. 06-156-4C]OZD25411.1 TIGR03089 family protein [Rhodococcus sp. 06-156-4a]OZD32975.1 TIGR03089 family protein [Rhodococcus sp. 06-156-3b]OZD41950.1 TIGR03089 family protein [Rhodococcus sp. 06-156-3]